MDRACRLCDGGGWILCMRTWFVYDGFTREKCHSCQGRGHSPEFVNSIWTATQKRFRERLDEFKRTGHWVNDNGDRWLPSGERAALTPEQE